MSFGERLRAAREQRGFTQQQVADFMGIDKSTYCGYETGKRQPDVPKIKQLSKALGVSGDVLLETGFEKTPTLVSEDGLDDETKEIAEAYKIADPYVQFGVRKLLGLDMQDETIRFAARKSNQPRTSMGPDTDVEI